MRRLNRVVAVIAVGLLLPSVLRAVTYGSGGGESSIDSRALGALDEVTSALSAKGGKQSASEQFRKKFQDINAVLNKQVPALQEKIGKLYDSTQELDRVGEAYYVLPNLQKRQALQKEEAEIKKAQDAVAGFSVPQNFAFNAIDLNNVEQECNDSAFAALKAVSAKGKQVGDDFNKVADTILGDKEEKNQKQVKELTAKLKKGILDQQKLDKQARFDEQKASKEVSLNKFDIEKQSLWIDNKIKENEESIDDLQTKFLLGRVDYFAEIGGKKQTRRDAIKAGTRLRDMLNSYVGTMHQAARQAAQNNTATCKRNVNRLGDMSVRQDGTCTGTGDFGRVCKKAMKDNLVLAQVAEAAEDAADITCPNTLASVDETFAQFYPAADALAQQPSVTAQVEGARSLFDNLNNASQNLATMLSANVRACDESSKIRKDVQAFLRKGGSGGGAGNGQVAAGRPRGNFGDQSPGGGGRRNGARAGQAHTTL